MTNKILRSGKLAAVLSLLLLLFPFMVRAQQPVVYGVFFYSPACPHCHEVMDNHWPGIQAEFGDQLQVRFVDVTTPEGSALMRSALTTLNIRSNAVPMLIMGSEVLVGSVDIPQYAPVIIRSGLTRGGIGQPLIPGIAAWFQTPQDSATTAGPTRNLFDDPANTIAVGVLVGLVISLGLIAAAFWLDIRRHNRRLLALISGPLGRWVQFIVALSGIGLTASLVLGSAENGLITLLASGLALIFLLLAAVRLKTPATQPLPQWLVPLIAVAGLLVAGYLAYVEITLAEAACGAIGECNIVQQSVYARILGIPIGVLGIVGYATILILWLSGRPEQLPWSNALLFAIAGLGVLFSTYLTFLEPFVIGASCVWCLTSAVLMALLLWMMLPSAREFIQQRQPPRRRRRAKAV